MLILEYVNYSMARWVNDDNDDDDENTSVVLSTEESKKKAWETIQALEDDGKLFGVMIVQDMWNRPVLLFRNEWKIDDLMKDCKLNLAPWFYPPDLV